MHVIVHTIPLSPPRFVTSTFALVSESLISFDTRWGSDCSSLFFLACCPSVKFTLSFVDNELALENGEPSILRRDAH